METPRHSNIEYELEEKFIRGLRSVFAKDNDFRYNEKDKDSKVLITGDYPDKKIVEKTPHIIVSGINFQTDPELGFTNTFSRDMTYNGMVNGAQVYVNVIPYSLSIISLGEWYDSKDLGARVFEYLRFVANEYFSLNLELYLRSITKNQTVLSKQYPEKIFETVIGVSGTLYWAGAKTPNFLSDIDTPLTNINIKF